MTGRTPGRARRLVATLPDDERGVAVIEAALMLPLLLGFAFAAVDTSNFLAQTHRVEQGLSAAGSYLSKAPAPETLTARAANIAATGSPSGSGGARVPGWNAGDVSITFRTASGDFRTGDTGRVVVLSTLHTYEGFGFLSALSGGRVRIRASHEERVKA